MTSRLGSAISAAAVASTPSTTQISSLESTTDEVASRSFELAKVERHLPVLGGEGKDREITVQTPSLSMKASPPPAVDDPRFLTPPLTGDYPVGVKSYITDDSRRLLIDVHYPGEPSKNPVYKVHPSSTGRHPLNVENDPAKEKMSNLWTRSEPGLSPVAGEKFPIIFFSHGNSTNHYDYQPIVEEVASQGYCVITISHPSSNNSSAFARLDPARDPMPTDDQFMKAVDEGSEDVQAVLEQIKHNQIEGFSSFLGASINTDAVGVLGHSLGGGTVLKTCLETKLVKAGIDLDGCPLTHEKEIAFKQPYLTIASGKNGLWSPGEEYYEDWQKSHTKTPQAQLIVLKEAEHMDFAVNPLFQAKKNDEFTQPFLETYKQVNQLIVSFFNQHLR